MTAAAPPLVLADLDGTLIAPGGKMPASVGELVEVCVAGGGALVPVSARPAPHIASLFAAHPDVDLAVGSGGGVLAAITAGKVSTVVDEQLLDCAEAGSLVDTFRQMAERRDATFFAFLGSAAEFCVLVAGVGLNPTDLGVIVGPRPSRIVDTDELVGELLRSPALGVSVLVRTGAEAVRALDLDRLLPSTWRSSIYPEVRAPEWSWYEALPKAANKGTGSRLAIARWIETTGATPFTTAVGDSVDDIAMFRVAARSLCPGDAAAPVALAATKALDAPGGAPFVRALIDLLRADALPRSASTC